METCNPNIEAAGHRLTLELPGRRTALQADRTRLTQVFANLVNNACKYTAPGGQIALRARRVALPEGQPAQVCVAVEDKGIGIEPAALPLLFRKFSQLGPPLQRAHGGLGVGLSLVQRLAQMHGGSVQARSEGLGRGSVFEVRLPIDVPPTPRRRPPRCTGRCAARRRPAGCWWWTTTAMAPIRWRCCCSSRAIRRARPTTASAA